MQLAPKTWNRLKNNINRLNVLRQKQIMLTMFNGKSIEDYSYCDQEPKHVGIMNIAKVNFNLRVIIFDM